MFVFPFSVFSFIFFVSDETERENEARKKGEERMRAYESVRVCV